MFSSSYVFAFTSNNGYNGVDQLRFQPYTAMASVFPNFRIIDW